MQTFRDPSFRDGAIGRPPVSGAEPPRIEPEIIPPGPDPSPKPHPETFVFADRGVRIQFARPGPLGIALVLLATVLVGALSLLILAGAALVGAVAVGIGLVIAFVSRLLRRPLWR